jgi:DNA-binding NtrC family response regulator
MESESNSFSLDQGEINAKQISLAVSDLAKKAAEPPSYNENDYFLNYEDEKKAATLFESIDNVEKTDYDQLRKKILNFTKHIEKNYKIKKLPLDIFGYDSYESSCAASAYFLLHLKLFSKAIDFQIDCSYYKSDGYYIPKITKHFEEMRSKINSSKELKSIPSKNVDDSYKSNLAMRLKDSLYVLMMLHRFVTKNKMEFLKTYHDWIEAIASIPFYESGSEGSGRYNEAFGWLIKAVKKNDEIAIGKKAFGNDPALINSYVKALSCADDNRPILIVGETGTGKELVARSIHLFSNRKNNTFQPLNCGAVTETLFDSEISGVSSGTATNVGPRLGVFLSASSKEGEGYHVQNDGQINFLKANRREVDPTSEDLKSVGGTVFLDEINTISTELQTKLLRIIQENKVRVVGEYFDRSFDVKLICASNQDLKNLISEGEFKEDLYHRIGACIVRVPPLREMKGSLRDLAELKLNEISKEIDFKRNPKLEDSALKIIENYAWPGNFRELDNILYEALIELRLKGENKITGSQIKRILDEREASHNSDTEQMIFEKKFIKFNEADLLKYYFCLAMKECNYEMSKVIEVTGLSESAIKRRKKKYILK